MPLNFRLTPHYAELRKLVRKLHGARVRENGEQVMEGITARHPDAKMFGQRLEKLHPYLPKEITTPMPGPHYRGILIPREQAKQFLRHGGKLKARPFQSWTDDIDLARDYARRVPTRRPNSRIGIVIRKNLQPKHTLLNANAAHQLLHDTDNDYQPEVVARGNHPDLLHIKPTDIVSVHGHDKNWNIKSRPFGVKPRLVLL